MVAEADAFALVDGQYGMGQTIGPQAVQVGVVKARSAGVAVVALRHAGHLGRIGEWAELAAASGRSPSTSSTWPAGSWSPPFGGIDRRMATNPVCIGVPLGDGRPPLILDFATSLVAEGKALVAFDGGAPLPPAA